MITLYEVTPYSSSISHNGHLQREISFFSFFEPRALIYYSTELFNIKGASLAFIIHF